MATAHPDDQIERAVLGSILSGSGIPENISEEMFFSPRNKIIFRALTELSKTCIPDILLLNRRLCDTGEADSAGGPGYYASLTDFVPGPDNVKHYLDKLQENYRDHKAEKAIRQAAEDLQKPSLRISDIVSALTQNLSAYGQEKIRNGFRFIRIDSVDLKIPVHLIKGFLEKDSFSCLYSDSGAGKSFLAIETAACVATGTPFYGLPVKQGPVIYLAGEGQGGLSRRFKAWSIARGVSLKDALLYMHIGNFNLIHPELMVPVVNALEKLINELGRPPALVILDTWSRTLGGDDSAPSDAAAGVAALDSLRSRFENYAVLVVHHEGHIKGRSRGWSGLRAAVDMEYRAERGSDGILRLECTKAKDSAPMEPMSFQFVEVELPLRHDSGEPVTSAVLNQVEWTPAPQPGKEPAMGKNQSLALRILNRLLAAGPVTVEDWREACYAEEMTRQRFNEVRKTLSESGKININNLIVTVCERTNERTVPYI